MSEPREDQTLLKFRLCAMTGAVPLAFAGEVLPMAELIRPPRLHDTVEGLLDLGGAALPVLRLDRLLGLEGFRPTIDSHLILTRATGVACLLLVDRVLGVERVAAAALKPVPDYVTASACVRTQYQSSDTAVHVLDLGVLLKSRGPALKVVA